MKTRLLLSFTIIGIALFTVYGIWNSTDTQKQTFQYLVDYDDLLVRSVGMSVYKTVENHPNQDCFQLSSQEVEKFPDDFLDDLKSASEEEFHDSPQIYPPGVYTGYGMTVKKEVALDLLTKYNFNETKTVFSDNIASMPDAQYQFDCFFEYEDKQYMLRISFQNQISDGNFVNVNFTQNSGFPHIENQHITVFYGGFNSTVLFHNNLDEDVILYSNDPVVNFIDADDGDVHENRFAKTLNEFETVIPPGKFFSYYFSPYDDKNNEPISYVVKPFDLQGSVTVKPYPRCMTENDVTSLYGTVKVYPKFPKYLPEGYSFECGVHNTNAYVHLVYFTDEQRSKFPDTHNSAFDREFFSDGGLVIDYYDEAWNGWIEDPNYDKFEKAQENSEHPQSKTLTISDQPAVMIKEYSWKDGKQQSFNRLEIFLDEEQIRIKSSLGEEEIIKIAESFF
ncbi:MAG: hypothetical protein K5790_05860 [Nitrosopumilus sp.]|uniref:hypothetical protein n=1 Tax=Nitrosopumilus sp. TaxID=2024843 RepID=UPI00247E16DF|nr:hypothetical protein [Nitrosopumilus sp.]MCV0392806.1 hypothetical protein [Nitrosopumilus sp.]